jgi:predicted deacylase
MSRRALILFALAAALIATAVGTFVLLREPELVPAPLEPHGSETRVIGTSLNGRPIAAYTFGSGEQHLLFVGGVHGGYEWNSTLLAFEFFDYLSQNPQAVPQNVTVTIIPTLNPDGTYAVVAGESERFSAAQVVDDEVLEAQARFNARGVDLNRNFDCKWQPKSSWRGQEVSAGTGPFSEPEAAALRDYVFVHQPVAVVFWHSQANAVYASECEAGVLPATRALMNAYADSAGYSAIDSFDAYPVTGDAEGWLASLGIPAITVELATHEAVEWEKNLKGFEALMALYAR